MVFEYPNAGEESPLPYEPHLSFRPEAWRKLRLCLELCPFEIGGLGLVESRGEDFVVTEILLVAQDVNEIGTRLDRGALSELLISLVKSGQDPERLKLWWHGHGKEAPFWSEIDEQTIEDFQNDYMISLVCNGKLRCLARLDRYSPRTTIWVWIDKPTEEVKPTPEETETVRAEIAAKVRYVPGVFIKMF